MPGCPCCNTKLLVYAEESLQGLVGAVLAQGGLKLLHSRIRGGYHPLHTAAAKQDAGVAMKIILNHICKDEPSKLVRTQVALQNLAVKASKHLISHHLCASEYMAADDDMYWLIAKHA